MRILIDGDACPVVDSIVRITAETGILYIYFALIVILLFMIFLRMQKSNISMADVMLLILCYSNMQKRMILLSHKTMGQPVQCQKKVKHVLHHNGHIYTSENIDRLLAQRYYHQQARRKQNVIIKGRLHSIKSNDSILKHLFATVSNLHSCACVLTFLVLLHMHFFCFKL